jgi:hypothetical protein
VVVVWLLSGSFWVGGLVAVVSGLVVWLRWLVVWVCGWWCGGGLVVVWVVLGGWSGCGGFGAGGLVAVVGGLGVWVVVWWWSGCCLGRFGWVVWLRWFRGGPGGGLVALVVFSVVRLVWWLCVVWGCLGRCGV